MAPASSCALLSGIRGNAPIVRVCFVLDSSEPPLPTASVTYQSPSPPCEPSGTPGKASAYHRKGPAAPRLSTALRAVLHSARSSLRYGPSGDTLTPLPYGSCGCLKANIL